MVCRPASGRRPCRPRRRIHVPRESTARRWKVSRSLVGRPHDSPGPRRLAARVRSAVAKNAQKTGASFAGYSMPEMKRELYHEFGQSLGSRRRSTTSSSTRRQRSHGPSDVRSFTAPACITSAFAVSRRANRVSARGGRVSQSGRLLSTAAAKRHDSCAQARSATTTSHPTACLSVRCIGRQRARRLVDNADTIIHEATHQTAFNVGIHTRLADTTPQWLVEGLATMFEARGVWNSQSFQSLKDRVNAGRLRDFRKRVAQGRCRRAFADWSRRTSYFESTRRRYAEAWALSFYLCETRPRQYVAVPAQDGRATGFRPYPARADGRFRKSSAATSRSSKRIFWRGWLT